LEDFTEGLAVGYSVSSWDGVAVGSSVGSSENLTSRDGVAVGSSVGISEDFVEGLAVGYSLRSKDAVAVGSSVGISEDFVEGGLAVVGDSVSSKVVGFDVIGGFSLGLSVNVGLKEGLATTVGGMLFDGAELVDGFDVIEGFSLGLSVNVGLKEGLATAVGGMLFDGAVLVDGAMLIDGASEGVESTNAAMTGGRCTGLNEGGELVEDGATSTREGRRCTVGDSVNVRGTSFESSSPWNSLIAGCATFRSPPFPIRIQSRPPIIPTIPIAVKAAVATTTLVLPPTAATAVVGVAGRRWRATFSLPRRASAVDARIIISGIAVVLSGCVVNYRRRMLGYYVPTHPFCLRPTLTRT
jgi:hypothetical protein